MEKTLKFKPMPIWVVEGYKTSLMEEIENGIIKTMTDAFYFTKGWFSQKECIPNEAIVYMAELHDKELLTR